MTAITARILVTFLVKRTFFRAVSGNTPLRPLFYVFFSLFLDLFNFSPVFFFTRVSFHVLFSCCFFLLAFLVNFSFFKKGKNGSLSEKHWEIWK